MSDQLWQEFDPLWTAMLAAAPAPLLAGGYGLFLKESWTRADGRTIAVPLPQWRVNAPRATKDVDLIVSLEVIADPAQMAVVARALRGRGFRDEAPRWKYAKALAPDRDIIVELHAPAPPDGHAQVRSDGYRVKPSRREGAEVDRIHGRHNPEAVGCDLHPFTFTWQGINLAVPNPLTWAIMKITAAADRLADSQRVDLSADKRGKQQTQATKHAVDVGRVVALMDAAEFGNIAAVRTAVANHPAYVQACTHRHALFDSNGVMVQVLDDHWDAAGVGVIRTQLANWFP